MQLKKQKAIRQLLTAATSTLLAGTAQQVLAAGRGANQVDSAVLYYTEKNRVTVFEPAVKIRREVGDDEFISFKGVIDSMTGSSPNGAIPTDSPQTFASPSGGSTYTTPAGETPLDPSFHDTRYAISADWEKPLHRTLKAVLGANISTETDYSSLGVDGNLAWDLNQRNTTLSTGLSLSHDVVSPVGGQHDGLTAVPTTATKTGGGEDDNTGPGISKNSVELLLGLTQVLGPKTLLQLNYTIGKEQGYLTDPYKLLSVLDSAGNLRSTDPYLYEKRPDNRQRQAFYIKGVQQFGEDVLHLSYRYYKDDWGVTSDTWELHYRFEFAGGRQYLQPHYRYYKQTKADFYYYSLQDGNIPAYASADYRLGNMSTTTFGVKYGMVLGENNELGVRLESMVQKPEGDARFEQNKAIILQLNYSLVF